MKVIIIEDEAPAFRRLQKMLESLDPSLEILEVLDGVQSALFWLRSNTEPDLIFMDIQLSDGISFEIFDQINITKPVIFTTAFDDYMLRAFKVNSIDYLLKPIIEEDLKRSLDKYRNLKTEFSQTKSPDIQELIKTVRRGDKKFKSRFLVKMGDKLFAVQITDVACFQAKNGVVYLFTHEEKKYVMDFTLDEIIDDLDPDQFFRVNRQYILCIDTISAAHRLGKGKLLLDTHIQQEEQIIVSSEKGASFKEWMG